ncbi:MAG: hypothetical protein M1833_004986 [Piccolia ochrophora]|nr:MAG: hypothetical protein M1833_004986 [Piccolia ochrophora]
MNLIKLRWERLSYRMCTSYDFGSEPYAHYSRFEKPLTRNPHVKYAQELLTTFDSPEVIGEVALIPAVGGTFVVEIWHAVGSGEGGAARSEVKKRVLWDRKAEGAFPGAS